MKALIPLHRLSTAFLWICVLSLLISIPFQKTLVLFQSSSVIGIEYIEFASAKLSTTDVIAIMLVLAFFVNLFCSRSFLSTFPYFSKALEQFGRQLFHVKQLLQYFLFRLFHVKQSRCQLQRDARMFHVKHSLLSLQLFHVKQLLVPVCLLVLAYIPSMRTAVSHDLSMLYLLRIALHLSTFLVILSLPNAFLRFSAKIVVLLALLSSLVALAQFSLQSSVGLSWLGEIANLSPSVPGVSRFHAGDGVLLRSYGTFHHPNILGYFFVVALFLLPYVSRETYGSLQLFHVKQLVGVLLACGVSLTGSRIHSAFALLALLLYSFQYMFHVKHILKNSKRDVSRETSPVSRMFHVKHSLVVAITIFAMVSLLLSFFLRSSLAIVSRETIAGLDHTSNVSRETFVPTRAFYFTRGLEYLDRLPLGLGGFPVYLHIENPGLPNWGVQPIHTVPLLLLVEVGIIATFFTSLLLFVYVRLYFSSIVSRETIAPLLFLLFFFCASLVDHYQYTSIQGSTITFVSLAIVGRLAYARNQSLAWTNPAEL